jgi:hypothetical protein
MRCRAFYLQPTKPVCIRQHFAGPRGLFSVVIFNAEPGTLRLFFLVVYKRWAIVNLNYSFVQQPSATETDASE